MRARLLAAAAAASLCLGVLAPAAPAMASPRHFANCTAVHAVYSGGIAKKGVKKNTVTKHGTKTRRALKGHVKHSTSLYRANRKLDRDRDGIACEKS